MPANLTNNMGGTEPQLNIPIPTGSSIGNRDHLLQDEEVPETHVGVPTDLFIENTQQPLENVNFNPEENYIYENENQEYFVNLPSENIEPQIFNDQPQPRKNKVLFLLQKFTLYETRTHFYIVGSNAREMRFRILEIDLTVPQDVLSIKERGGPYNRHEVMEVLATFEAENKNNGGFTKLLTAWGIMGFIRFTKGYYISVITKRSTVALIGGHYVYHIDETQLLPLCHSSIYRKPDRRSEENRYLTTFQSFDLSKTFYFSYTYNITQTLQTNLVREKRNLDNRNEKRSFQDYNKMFVWNQALLKPTMSGFENSIRWFLPIIHGFMDQAKIDVYGRTIYITIIARRSQYFAGARFLKRGVNVDGRVANEVETEQIVADINTSSFHDPRKGLFNSPRYTSYVQHRGSIPLFWSQDVTNMSPKPPISLDTPDPFFAAAALHFDDMFGRYGPRIRILNLIKRRERNPRETKLGVKFNECIKYLNQFLPDDKKMDYTAWDMSRASRSRDQDVIEFLEKYADETLQQTGFFRNGSGAEDITIQSGICRTNCIDCLDRTNAAQFVIGKKALGYQLHVLNVISNTDIDYDSDAVDLLTEMFHDHGDTIALQYGGSHLVNTMETYRKINQWSSHSRDLIESLRRFYSNSFMDSQRQDAINLFLGNFKWKEGRPRLWDLSTDYYLHNNLSIRKARRSYIKWWTPNNLQSAPERVAKELQPLHEHIILSEDPNINEFLIQNLFFTRLGTFDNYWNEYYKPRILTSFKSLFAYNMNSTLRYAPKTDKRAYLQGPFKSRKPIASHRPPKSSKDKHSKQGRLKQTTDNQQYDQKKELALEEKSENAPECIDIPALVDEHKTHEYEEKRKEEDMESKSSGIGALVQASSKFYKKPSFHRLLSEPVRLSGRLWGSTKHGDGNIKEFHKERMNSTDSSMGNSFVGANLEDSFLSNGLVDYEGENDTNEKSVEEVLAELHSTKVSEQQMQIYKKYADFEELIAPEVNGTNTENIYPNNLDSSYSDSKRYLSSPQVKNASHNNHHRYKNSLSEKGNYLSDTKDERYDDVSRKNFYSKSLDVYRNVVEDVPFHDQRVYEFAYSMSRMNNPKATDKRYMTLVDVLKTDQKNNESCLMGYGGASNVVSESNVDYYSNWLNGNE